MTISRMGTLSCLPVLPSAGYDIVLGNRTFSSLSHQQTPNAVNTNHVSYYTIGVEVCHTVPIYRIYCIYTELQPIHLAFLIILNNIHTCQSEDRALQSNTN